MFFVARRVQIAMIGVVPGGASRSDLAYVSRSGALIPARSSPLYNTARPPGHGRAGVFLC